MTLILNLYSMLQISVRDWSVVAPIVEPVTYFLYTCCHSGPLTSSSLCVRRKKHSSFFVYLRTLRTGPSKAFPREQLKRISLPSLFTCSCVALEVQSTEAGTHV